MLQASYLFRSNGRAAEFFIVCTFLLTIGACSTDPVASREYLLQKRQIDNAASLNQPKSTRLDAIRPQADIRDIHALPEIYRYAESPKFGSSTKLDDRYKKAEDTSAILASLGFTCLRMTTVSLRPGESVDVFLDVNSDSQSGNNAFLVTAFQLACLEVSCENIVYRPSFQEVQSRDVYYEKTPNPVIVSFPRRRGGDRIDRLEIINDGNPASSLRPTRLVAITWKSRGYSSKLDEIVVSGIIGRRTGYDLVPFPINIFLAPEEFPGESKCSK